MKLYKGRIEALEFNFYTPNMAAISKSLIEDIKEISKNSNSVKNKLEFKADEHSSLIIEKDNKQMAGLIDYCGAGRGDAKIKAHGIRKRITVGENIQEFEIDMLELESNDPEKILTTLKRYLND
ncbi:hypothetical protein QWA_03190 [Alcaligenes faecalis subsp. faecalis NCIB 8687]|nr:hypothetical protein QWA_03190 [Alcaligenes faecalis subsp. faecalis NCIB 8687]